MAKTIQQVEFALPKQPQATRVAAYGRVSRDGDAMRHSLSQQISYYSDMIQKHPGWFFSGIYADEAITGTIALERPNFQRLLADCRARKIDLVIVKSVSRFARNTVDFLATVRELKELGVDIFFEEQNLHTKSSDGELMLTILASYAQEESRSVSENMKWRIKKNFTEGMPWNATLLGYRYKDGKYEVVPEEAEVVKRIFDEYLSGKGQLAIAKELNDEGIPTRFDNAWGRSSVGKILRNYTYTGNLLLQKVFREDHLTKKTVKNQGQLPQYHALEAHEPIISMETYEAVQLEIAKREKHYRKESGTKKKTYPFSGLIVCEKCGKHYARKTTATGIVWICQTYDSYGKKACPAKQIPDEKLTAACADIDLAMVQEITAKSKNTLTIHFKDGSSTDRVWKDRSRAESWTPEMKAAARQRILERNAKNAEGSSNTRND